SISFYARSRSMLQRVPDTDENPGNRFLCVPYSPFQKSRDSRWQLVYLFWLLEKLVNADAPRFSFAIAAREHDDWRAAAVANLADALGQFQSIQFGKIIIDYEQIIVLVARQFSQRRVSVGADLDMPLFGGEHIGNQFRNLRIVLDVQN